MAGSLNKFAPEIVNSGIFNNINNFSELIERISNTKEFNNRGVQKTKGDIFEIFSEALLNIDKRFQAKKVYPQGYIPTIILDKLKMHEEDYGYDGLYITNDEKYIIYQSKFRSTDEKINWQGKNGLSSFIGVSNKVDNYHLISSTSDVSKYFLDKENILLSLENELQNLDKSIFKKIENWLKGKPHTFIGLHKPDKHQLIALKKISQELIKNSRATVVMACGTGKTDVGFWYYKANMPKLALVLVPSIALVKQIRSDWLSQITDEIVTFQLCSSKDTTKKDDEYIIEKKDLGMTIETDPIILKKWLNKYKNKNKIIFSTYQSSKILKKSLKKNQFIDIAIFDEAHRTATVKKNIDSNFNFALFDKNIPIKKRLFMTATRRILSTRQTDTTGSGKLLVSMDNENIYGKICYNLSFYEASKKFNAIARPKIILTEVLNHEVDELLTRISSSDVKGQKIKSDYLASQISLKKAILKKKIKKVFCFHNTVAQSKTFTNGVSPESIGYHLKNYYVDYVSGAMRIKLRDKKMQLFKSNSHSIISNARCLIEGVDVPSVEMVAFISPKKSEIDIVQAVGRALRNRSNPNKKFGYIHVPVFINKYKNQKISDAIDKSNFDNLVLIIKALREHDDEINQIIEDILVSKSRGKGFSKKAAERISEIIESDFSVIPKKIINQSIQSKIIEKIRLKWDEMVGRLLAFKDKYGHLKITNEYKEFKDLYIWVLKIRRLYQDNKLLNFQIDQLNKINFFWSDHRATITNVNKYLTRKKLAKKFGIDTGTIARLVDKKIIKPIGKGFYIGEGITEFYKDYSKKEFLNICKIDFLPRDHNLVSCGYLAEKFGVNYLILEKFIKKKSKGKSFTTQGVKELYKNYSEKEIKELLGIDILNTKKLHTLNSLAVSLGKKGMNYHLKRLYKEGLLKPVGIGISSQGKSPYFNKISKKKFMRLLGIDFFGHNKKFTTLKKLEKTLGISYNTLFKLKSHLKYVGKGMSNAKISDFYKIEDKNKFYKKLGIVQKDKNFHTINKLLKLIRKKYGKGPAGHTRFLKFAKEENIKPVGKIISNKGGFSEVFKMINDNQYKKMMGIDILRKRPNILSLHRIQKKYRYDRNKIKKLVQNKIIKFAGKGLAGNVVRNLYFDPGKKIS